MHGQQNIKTILCHADSRTNFQTPTPISWYPTTHNQIRKGHRLVLVVIQDSTVHLLPSYPYLPHLPYPPPKLIVLCWFTYDDDNDNNNKHYYYYYYYYY